MKKVISIILLPILIITIFTSCRKTGSAETIEANGTLMNYTAVLDGCGYLVRLDSGSGLEIAKSPAGVTLVDNKRVKVRYKIIDGFSACMAGEIVEITYLEYL